MYLIQVGFIEMGEYLKWQKRQEYNKQWQESHKEHVKEWRKQYYVAHRQEILDKYHKWYEKNKEELLVSRSILHQEAKPKRGHVLSEREAGFLEGLIDGEGCISWRHHKHKTKSWVFILNITNLNEALIRKTHSIIGEGTVRPRIHKGSRQTVWVYVCSAESLRWLLPQLDLIVKAEEKYKALKALALIKSTPRLSHKTPKYYEELASILVKS